MIFADDAVEELRTLGDLVRWGASCFQEAELTYGHGSDNALDEAYNLVRHALHLPHDIPAYMSTCNITKAERRKVVQLLTERVMSRKPAPYLIHEAWFAGLPFYVDERVLIPRSPIAELIEAQFEPWVDPERVHRILDLCTGSGCIAVACALAFPEARVDASDVSEEALEVAAANVENYALKEQVYLIVSDVFDGLKSAQQSRELKASREPGTSGGKANSGKVISLHGANPQYDIIVSNPPYVNAEDMAALTEEFRHEPPLALAAGHDGLDVVKRILQQAYDYLSPQGILVVEVGNSYPELIEQFPHLPFVWPEFVKGGHGVFVLTREQLKNV
ncbi:MAG: 50S ribosomal protein L3 N(5)-glutamine methyltransferase [Gammaproteobacteria bacterium]|jgi:ribosomal protein L3 glutamine methyltransferase|nr:50S ribosomal protein L3 N(5)-glutamine methyltransferase [Gammaproteobacteria bacterium]